MSILIELQQVLHERRQADPGSSYVASLHHKGLNKILEKVGEEAVETILAAKDAAQGGDRDAVVRETADLWFHSLVMLSHLDLTHEAVLAELARRFGTSGHEEKAARPGGEAAQRDSGEAAQRDSGEAARTDSGTAAQTDSG